MAQAKKKTSTKTKKTTAARRTGSKANTRTTKKQCVSNKDRMHVYLVTAMALVVGILLCANAAMMMV